MKVMKHVKCSKCKRKAVIYLRHANLHLCDRHFEEYFERKVKYAMNKYKMVESGDKIAIALSGGKDSVTLTYVLHKHLTRKDIEMFAITVDEGIRGYRDNTVKIAKDLTSDLGIEHVVVSFRDEFGMTLDEIVKVGKRKPCTYCGVFRKYLLNRTAREMGATKIATGHNLDDEVQTILLNFLQSDMERLARLIPQRVQEGLILRIKPLRELYERDVVVYGLLHNLPIDLNECPYSRLPVRAIVRDFIYEFENRYPGRKYSIMRSFETLIPCLKDMFPQVGLKRCLRCGEPTSKEICQACKLLEELGLDF